MAHQGHKQRGFGLFFHFNHTYLVDSFKLFLEVIEPQQVINAALAARKQAGCEKARFGDCNDVSDFTVTLLSQMGIPARRKSGHFVTNPKENEEWEHSWVIINGEILDPTIDQFFSSLDIDLVTEVPGIYYTEIDGDWLRNRYKFF